MNRVSVLAALLAVICIPKAALADRQSDKKAFIASCDESISIARLFGAPRKFVGKHVDIRGIVGPATDNPKVINISFKGGETSERLAITDRSRLQRWNAAVEDTLRGVGERLGF